MLFHRYLLLKFQVFFIIGLIVFYSFPVFTPIVQAQQNLLTPGKTIPPSVKIKTDSLAKYFPADDLFYIEANNLTKVVDELLKLEEVQTLITSLGLGNKQIGDLTRYDLLLSVLGFPDKATLASTRLAISVNVKIPSPAISSKISSTVHKSEPEPEVLALLEMPTASSAEQLVKTATELVNRNSKRVSSSVMMGKTKITIYPDRNPSKSAAYAQVDKFLVIGNIPAVRSVIANLSSPPVKNLVNSVDFVNVSNHVKFSEENLFGYINTQAAGDLLSKGLQSFNLSTSPTSPSRNSRHGKKITTKTLIVDKKKDALTTLTSNLVDYLGLKSTGGVGFSWGVSNGQITQKTFAAVDRTGKGLFPIIADAPNVTLRAANFVPDSSHVFITAGVNQLRLYDEILEIARSLTSNANGKGNQVDIGLAGVEVMLGVKLRDELLAGFDGECSIALDSGDMSQLLEKGLSANNHIVFYAGMKNPDMVKSSFEKIIAVTAEHNKQEDNSTTNSSKVQKETYQDIEIFTIQSTSIVYLDNILLLGRTSDIKWALDAYKSGNILSKSEDYQKVMKDTPPDSIESVYLSEKFYKNFSERISEKNVSPEVRTMLSKLKTPPSIGGHVRRDETGIYAEQTSPLSTSLYGILVTTALIGIKNTSVIPPVDKKILIK